MPPHLAAFSNLPRALTRLVGLSQAHAWILVIFFIDVTALADLVTGPALWLGPVYLIVICLAAWALGWRGGLITGLGCMTLTFAINGTGLYPYGGTAILANLATRFVAILVVIVIIEGVRWAYINEWYHARKDTLTGALNRQAFFELGASHAGSSAWRLLIYADLDGLKIINDKQGHSAGDTCLKRYASSVRTMIRREDIFARVGGDEFLVYMVVKNETAARLVASRLHSEMNSIPGEDCTKINCSVGALIVPPGRHSIDELVRLADGLMYDAKSRKACLQVGLAADSPGEFGSGRARLAPRRSVIFSATRRKRDRDRRDPNTPPSLSLPRAPC